MKLLVRILVCATLLRGIAFAQLAVTVSPLTITGQKAVVPLALKNNLSERIESARAAVFLLDEQGKMVGQATKWVIGGSEGGSGLVAGTTNVFHFVITSDKPFTTTNLTARINFSRIVVESGKLADPAKDVQIESLSK